MMLAHNHPSGNAKPSRADRALTYRIERVAQDLDVPLLAQLILARGRLGVEVTRPLDLGAA